MQDVFCLKARKFQSTLPARGATLLYSNCDPVHSISIHAPCTGSDVIYRLFFVIPSNFNPRSLHGERRYYTNKTALKGIISIHAPCTGSD